MAQVFARSLPEGSISEILAQLEGAVQTDARAVTGKDLSASKFNNPRGSWLEFVVALHGWNVLARLRDKRRPPQVFVRLPSASSLAFPQLFLADQSKAITEGLLSRLGEADVSLEMSNPDFLCVEVDSWPRSAISLTAVTTANETVLRGLIEAHRELVGACDFRRMAFTLSVKNSLRPDRRYQLIHEGTVVKALLAHLQTRFWDTSRSIRCYAGVAEPINDNSRRALGTATAQSIPDVRMPPEKAIDAAKAIQTTDEIRELVAHAVKESE